MRQLGNFGEKVMKELQNLQEHLNVVKHETIENVSVELPMGTSATFAGGGGSPSGNSDDAGFFMTQASAT